MAKKQNYSRLVDSWLADIEEELEENAKKVINEVTENACFFAQAKAPERTGTLVKSIKTDYPPEADGLLGVVGTNVEYSIYQEYGTKYIHGVHYMQEAFDAVIDEFIERMKNLDKE